VGRGRGRRGGVGRFETEFCLSLHKYMYKNKNTRTDSYSFSLYCLASFLMFWIGRRATHRSKHVKEGNEEEPIAAS
jgi:hypothetical protein